MAQAALAGLMAIPALQGIIDDAKTPGQLPGNMYGNGLPAMPASSTGGSQKKRSNLNQKSKQQLVMFAIISVVFSVSSVMLLLVVLVAT